MQLMTTARNHMNSNNNKQTNRTNMKIPALFFFVILGIASAQYLRTALTHTHGGASIPDDVIAQSTKNEAHFIYWDAGHKIVIVKIEGVAIEKDDIEIIKKAAKHAGLLNFSFESVTTSFEPKSSIVMASVDNNCDGVGAIDIAGTFCSNLHDLGFAEARDCEIIVVGGHLDKSNASNEIVYSSF